MRKSQGTFYRRALFGAMEGVQQQALVCEEQVQLVDTLFELVDRAFLVDEVRDGDTGGSVVSLRMLKESAEQ